MDMTNEHNSSIGLGRKAMILALTDTISEEEELKKKYRENGIQCVVTEVGGNSKHDFQEKLNRAVLGASLNAGVIVKESQEIHALIHAAEEAKKGMIFNVSSEANLAMKVAIVRKGHWISVAMFGESAFHPLTSHERCGMGIMNI